jgi:hypothetical protein
VGSVVPEKSGHAYSKRPIIVSGEGIMKHTQRFAYIAGILLLFVSSLASAANVHRMWNGRYHFYTTSITEAYYLVSLGWRLEAINYFTTDDTPYPGYSSRELLRCASGYKQVHAYFRRFFDGSGCEIANSFVTEGGMGYIRSRLGESQPIWWKGRPIYSMYQIIGKAPDGTNISRTLLTTSPQEAAQACGNYWMPGDGADYRTCLMGYVEN